MKNATVQARLDEASHRRLQRCLRQTGRSASQAIREGIRLLEQIGAAASARQVIGMGQSLQLGSTGAPAGGAPYWLARPALALRPVPIRAADSVPSLSM